MRASTGGVSGAGSVVVMALLAGCASIAPVETGPGHQSSIGQRLLQPEGGGMGSGEVQPYVLAATETFRMPEPLLSAAPVLPPGYARETLPPTTVCLQVVLDANGLVQRGEPLHAHSQCAAGQEAENAPLLESARRAVQQWRFEPAAICRFAPGISARAPGGCTGASSVETVPVTLLYAFTFEVKQGKVSVGVRGAVP
jgi:hypothetical protein